MQDIKHNLCPFFLHEKTFQTKCLRRMSQSSFMIFDALEEFIHLVLSRFSIHSIQTNECE